MTAELITDFDHPRVTGQKGSGGLTHVHDLPPGSLWELSRRLDAKFYDKPDNWLFDDYWYRLNNIKDRVNLKINRSFKR